VVLRALIGSDDDLGRALERFNRWTRYHRQPFVLTGLDGDQAAAHEVATAGLQPPTTSLDDALPSMDDVVPGLEDASAMSANTAETSPPIGPIGPRRPELSRFEHADHLIPATFHQSELFGHRQIFIFDNRWAATHSDLASSLIGYAPNWDPLS
jgi:hypothetical protein